LFKFTEPSIVKATFGEIRVMIKIVDRPNTTPIGQDRKTFFKDLPFLYAGEGLYRSPLAEADFVLNTIYS